MTDMDDDGPTQNPMRLIDRLTPLLDEIQRLDQHREQLKAEVRAVCGRPDLPEDELAEVYWLEESVPTTFLGRNSYEVVETARRHPYWSWRCVTCGSEVFVTSRSDKKRRESPPPDFADLPSRWQCPDCEAEARKTRWAALREYDKARQAREAELRTMPYREYLRTEEWQERRRGALKRAGHRCQVCDRSRQLHVHHRTYERRGAELARDLIVLCDECHALYHRKGLLATDTKDHV
jgi:rubredoxin